jgi:uncharacterized membrane protein (GlpM family)
LYICDYPASRTLAIFKVQSISAERKQQQQQPATAALHQHMASFASFLVVAATAVYFIDMSSLATKVMCSVVVLSVSSSTTDNNK